MKTAGECNMLSNMSSRPATFDDRRRFMTHRFPRLALALAFACGASAVLANGDEFFASSLRSVGAGGGARIGFLGSVKDDEGHYLEEAELTVLVTVPTGDGTEDVTYKSFTDVIGRYRTLDASDVVSIVKGIDIELKPTDVKLVGVSKEGYTQVRRFDRSRTGQSVREIDFVMKKIPN